MEKDFLEKLFHAHQAVHSRPSPFEVRQFYIELFAVLFPDFSHDSFSELKNLEHRVSELQRNLEEMIHHTNELKKSNAAEIAQAFFDSIPSICHQLEHDAIAMYDGDPAATSVSEVVRTYPGFYAVAAYRFAHRLHQLGVADIPRIITEHAHTKTGIDIHPAAKIGEHFCIDHGTGVVIGETTTIGNHVKIYQGVTLGALSVDKKDAEKKRHPDIEDNVIIYAGATILGGETVIGHDSVIGGNVWLTQSVPPYSKIYYNPKMQNGETHESNVLFRIK
jgi:serine O-acetyltransferase